MVTELHSTFLFKGRQCVRLPHQGGRMKVNRCRRDFQVTPLGKGDFSFPHLSIFSRKPKLLMVSRIMNHDTHN